MESPRDVHLERSAQTCAALRWALVLPLVVVTAALFLAAGCRHSTLTAAGPTALGFLSDRACAPCHPEEFKDHSGTRHKATLRSVDLLSMGDRLPAPGQIGDTNFTLYADGDRLKMGYSDKPAAEALPLDFALGAPRHVFTFMHVAADNRSAMELRQSYNPHERAWMRTPGPRTGPDTVGSPRNEEEARRCLSCHVTALPAAGIRPDPKFFGVGCESCHGPGRKHVEAVAAGKPDLQMPKLAALGGRELNTLCGRCHRTAQDLGPGAEEMTQRFAPYGLMRSRCFSGSGEKLSCLNCHDSHKNASTNHKDYEKACLSCHTATSGFGPADHRRKACPVNPRDGCIPCHMPQRKLDQNLPITMSDHMIRR